jgi:hypothetical protein
MSTDKTSMDYIIDIEEIKEHNPCDEGYTWVEANATNGKISRRKIFEQNRSWEYWLLETGICSAVVATSGHCGTAIAGNYGTAIAGDDGTATAGNYGMATAGNYGMATAGDGGTATAGHCGTATAGHCGTAIAGDCGTATAGNYGMATAGNEGCIQIKYYDIKSNRRRIATAYVGENGIKPNAKYKLNEQNKFVEVTTEKTK